MRGVVGQLLRGGGLELGSLFDLYPECVGDVAQPGQAGRAVPVGFVPLDLLLGHSKRVGELALRPPSGDVCLDQHGGQLGQCAGGERRAYPGSGLPATISFTSPKLSRNPSPPEPSRGQPATAPNRNGPPVIQALFTSERPGLALAWRGSRGMRMVAMRMSADVAPVWCREPACKRDAGGL